MVLLPSNLESVFCSFGVSLRYNSYRSTYFIWLSTLPPAIKLLASNPKPGTGKGVELRIPHDEPQGRRDSPESAPRLLLPFQVTVLGAELPLTTSLLVHLPYPDTVQSEREPKSYTIASNGARRPGLLESDGGVQFLQLTEPVRVLFMKNASAFLKNFLREPLIGRQEPEGKVQSS